MNEVELLSELIGLIYDAALDPDKWDGVLERTCGFLNCLNSTLASFDGIRRNVNVTKVWGYDPAYLKSYLEHYQRINPTISGAARAPVGEVITLGRGDMMPYEELCQTTLWREWAKPQGYVDGLQVNLEKRATAMAAFTAARHESVGMFDEGTLRRVHLLWPHFRRAVMIGKVIDLHKVEAAALADTLDGLAAATLLVDVDARIVHANASGQMLLDTGITLRRIDGKLAAKDAAANQKLRKAFVMASGGDLHVGLEGIAVPLASTTDEPYIAHVLPLTAGVRRKAGTEYAAVAAVFVHKASLNMPHPIDALAETFKLTPAELRVLMAVVNVGGVPEVAPVLGISVPTVKTHLQKIFDKTSTKRQADLVKLVAGYMSPLS